MLTEAIRDASLRVAGPEFVAPMYVWLAGPGSAHVTGQVFSVTGNFVGPVPQARGRQSSSPSGPNAEEPWALAELDQLVGSRYRK